MFCNICVLHASKPKYFNQINSLTNNYERPKQITFSACYKFKNSTTTMFVRVDDVSAAFWCDSLYELVGSETLSCLESGGF